MGYGLYNIRIPFSLAFVKSFSRSGVVKAMEESIHRTNVLVSSNICNSQIRELLILIYKNRLRSPPWFNCWTSVAPAFQSWFATDYSSFFFISVMNLDLYVRCFDSLMSRGLSRGPYTCVHI